MVWYYAEGNQQRGPLSDSEFEEAIGQGRIRRETLVWRDGMENWQSLAVLRPEAGKVLPEPTSLEGTHDTNAADAVLPPTPAQPAPVPTYTQQVSCNNCGRHVSTSEITRYGAVSICSVCRPGFVAQVQQGEGGENLPVATPFASAAPRVVYGGFWIRAVARSIDHIFIAILQMIFLSPLLRPMQSLLEGVTTLDQIIKLTPQLEEASAQVLPYMLLVSVLYHALFVAAFSGTPGKLMLGLRVIGKEGGRVNIGRAINRAVVPALLLILDRIFPLGIGTLVLLVGYFMIAFDAEKRSLFDRLAATRVIRRKG